jgi:hypothetical protein
MPLVNVDAMRQAYFRAGAKYNDVIFWSTSRSLCLWRRACSVFRPE